MFPMFPVWVWYGTSSTKVREDHCNIKLNFYTKRQNEELSKIAQNYANKLASLNPGLEHSNPKKIRRKFSCLMIVDMISILVIIRNASIMHYWWVI